MFVFTSTGEKALYFSPSEVDFLFPAPFHRRDLLVFKLSKTLFGLVFMALIFSISFLLYLNTWLSAFVGLFVALAFVQLLALVSAFLGQIVAEQAYTRRRRMVLVLIGVLVLAAVAQVLWQTPVTEPGRDGPKTSRFMDGHGGAGAFRGLQPRDSGDVAGFRIWSAGRRGAWRSTWRSWL